MAAIIVGFFAIFHGYAHGTELPVGADGLLFSLGFVIATGCLHLTGIGIGTVHRWRAGRLSLRFAGGLLLAGDSSRENMMMIHRGLRPPLIFLVLLTLAPSVATAHLTSTGFGPFYDGLTHLFMTPEDLLPVVALSLLAGLRGKRFGRTVLFTLPVACLAGSLASFFFSAPVSIPLAPALMARLSFKDSAKRRWVRLDLSNSVSG